MRRLLLYIPFLVSVKVDCDEFGIVEFCPVFSGFYCVQQCMQKGWTLNVKLIAAMQMQNESDKDACMVKEECRLEICVC